MEASIVIPKLEELLHSERAFYLDYSRVDRHQKRVMEISVYIAEIMGLSKEQIDNLRIAARFHDYGKRVWHHEMIHKKREHMDSFELYLVNMHSVASVALIDSELDHVKLEIIDREVIALLNGNYQTIFSMIEDHHENCDGSGHPHGLTASMISLEAQIMRVADSYDSMRSPRLYRSTKNQLMTHEKAAQELADNIGHEFSAEVVKTFLLIPRDKLERLYSGVSRLTKEKQERMYRDTSIVIPN
jgi:HD-GYP domain-containing protein (c-di-GMP phosphodiesterase class II)